MMLAIDVTGASISAINIEVHEFDWNHARKIDKVYTMLP